MVKVLSKVIKLMPATKLLERYWHYDVATQKWVFTYTKGYLKAHPEAARKAAEKKT